MMKKGMLRARSLSPRLMSVLYIGAGLIVFGGKACAASVITLAAGECMPARISDGNSTPMLPLYQPPVLPEGLDQVVKSPPNLPQDRVLSVWDAWDSGEPPIVPINSWWLGEFTGVTSTIALGSYQRGHTDQYGYSGVQVAGTTVGLWLNSMDPGAKLYYDSNALGMGCWYEASPRPSLFPSMAHQLDISFITGVKYDGSIAAATAQAYFEFVAIDGTGGCVVNDQKCGLTFQVGYYSRNRSYSRIELAHSDITGTTPHPIVQAAIESPNWLHRVPGDGSLDFQSEVFSPGLIHFRVSPEEFIKAIEAVRMLKVKSSQNDGGYTYPYAGISINPLDYEFSLIGADGEIYAPQGSHGQLGMSISNLRVTSTIPHHVSGEIAGFNEPLPGVVFRDGMDIKLLISNLDGKPNRLLNLASGSAEGDPVGYYAGNAARVIYRDSSHHLREIFESQTGWAEWDMTSTLGLPVLGADPRPFVGVDGSANVVYRDEAGDVHLLSLDASGWHDTNVSAASLPRGSAALGSPEGYIANGVKRIIYRDTNAGIVELYYFNGAWNQWQMTSITGSAPAFSDPTGYVDSSQRPHVIYRDSAGDIHEFRLDSDGWTHTDVTAATGAPSAQGKASGILAGDAPRAIYRGVDNHLHELVWWMNSWSHNDLSQTRGAVLLAGDPREFVGSDGVARIEYMGVDNQVHELFYGNGWIHRDM